MSLLCHINTRDLLTQHDDLLDDMFPHKHFQSGLDGTLEALDPNQDPVVLPVKFSSPSLNLMHYVPDGEVEYLNERTQTLKTPKDDPMYALPVLNVHNRGFYMVSKILDNTSCEIINLNPSEKTILDLAFGRDDPTEVEVGTDLQWSLGGYEDKIALAYTNLITELIKRKAVTAAYIDSNDPMYNQALRYHALQLIYMALSVEPGDKAERLAGTYYQLYQKELTNVSPTGYIHTSHKEFERC